MGMQYYYLP